MPNEQVGARFFDKQKHDRGWATKVVKREHALGKLIILEVTATDPELLTFLRALDRSPLHVQQTGVEGESYRFLWASGYENGVTVRVQGVLHSA